MRLTSIPQLARNANRLREVVTVLSRYGLAGWMSRLELHFIRGILKNADGVRLADQKPEWRVRMALTELGPTFIKIGQILSTRADLTGLELARELTLLQDATPADPFPAVRQTIETELGQPLEQVFAEFDERPLASASIAQVHRARLKEGPSVVVKVQHQAIEGKVRTDLDILVGLAELAEEHLAELKPYRPRSTAGEFQRMLLRELDFGREERNLSQFAANFSHNRNVHFPVTYPRFCTRRVLTMELLDGVKLSEQDRLRASGADLQEVARRGAVVFLDMIFRDGFYHADPHPGNIMLLEGGVIGMLDCGMVGRLDERSREDIEELLLAVGQSDATRLTSVITRIGSVPTGLDHTGLGADVGEFLSYYGSRSLKQLALGQALGDMLEIIRRYHIILPAQVALLIKVLVMLEGTSRGLNPQFDMLSLLVPYQRRVLRRWLSPVRRLRKLQNVVREWRYLGEILPRSVTDILQQLREKDFKVHLEHKHLDSSINRLVYGVLTSALFLGSSLMLSFKVPPALDEISLIGLAGLALSSVQAIRLFWAIRNSGRLD